MSHRPYANDEASKNGSPLSPVQPSIKEKLEDLKMKIIGTIGYVKGSMLSAKGKLLLKKAHAYQQKGEKLVGVGESLKALKPPKEPKPEKVKHMPPPPAAPAAYGVPPPPAPAGYAVPQPPAQAPIPAYG